MLVVLFFGEQQLAQQPTAGMNDPGVLFPKRQQVQDLREIALRLDVIDGSAYLMSGLRIEFNSTGILKRIGHYPFSDGWDGDCGLLGKKIELSGDMRQRGSIEKLAAARKLNNAYRLKGILPDGPFRERDVKCILVADEDGIVAGAGVVKRGNLDDDPTYFVALAPDNLNTYRVFVRYEGGETVQLRDATSHPR